MATPAEAAEAPRDSPAPPLSPPVVVKAPQEPEAASDDQPQEQQQAEAAEPVANPTAAAVVAAAEQPTEKEAAEPVADAVVIPTAEAVDDQEDKVKKGDGDEKQDSQEQQVETEENKEVVATGDAETVVEAAQADSEDKAEKGDEEKEKGEDDSESQVPAEAVVSRAGSLEDQDEAHHEQGDHLGDLDEKAEEAHNTQETQEEQPNESAFARIQELLPLLSQQELAKLSRLIPLVAMRCFIAATEEELAEDESQDMDAWDSRYRSQLPSAPGGRLVNSPTIPALGRNRPRNPSTSVVHSQPPTATAPEDPMTPRPPRHSVSSRRDSRSQLMMPSPIAVQVSADAAAASIPESVPASSSHSSLGSLTKSPSHSRLASPSANSMAASPSSAAAPPAAVARSPAPPASAALAASPNRPPLAPGDDSRSSFGEKRDRVRKKLLGDIVVTEQTYTENLENLLNSYVAPLKAKSLKRFTAPLSKDEANLIAGNIEAIVRFHKDTLYPQIVEQYGLEEGKQDFAELFIRNSRKLNELYTEWTKDAAARAACLNRLMAQPRFVKMVAEMRGAAAPAGPASPSRGGGRPPAPGSPASPAPPAASAVNVGGAEDEESLEAAFRLPQQRILDYLKMLWQLQQYGGGKDPKIQARMAEAMNCIKAISATIGNAPPSFN